MHALIHVLNPGPYAVVITVAAPGRKSPVQRIQHAVSQISTAFSKKKTIQQSTTTSVIHTTEASTGVSMTSVASLVEKDEKGGEV